MNLIELSNDFCQNYLVCLRRVAISADITLSQLLCLNAVPFSGISQSKLAKKLSLDLSTLSRNLNRLINMQLIDKNISKIDNRSYNINLTKKGVNFYNNIQQLINTEIHTIYESLEIDEINQLSELLNTINWKFDLLYR